MEQIGGGGASNGVVAENVYVSMPTLRTSPTGAGILWGNTTTGVQTNQVADIKINNSGCGGLEYFVLTASISDGMGGAGTQLNITATSPGNVAPFTLVPGMYLNDFFGNGTQNVLQPTKIVSGSGSSWVVDLSQHVTSQFIGAISVAHSCIRQAEGGNTKNVFVDFLLYNYVEVAADLANGSGFNDLTRLQGSNAFDAVYLLGPATFNIYDFEDESFAMLFRATCGTSPSTINVFGGSYESRPPTGGANSGLAINSACNVGLYGTQLFNAGSNSVPVGIRGVSYNDMNSFIALTVIGSWFQNAQNGVPFIFDGSGNDMVGWFSNTGSSAAFQVEVKNMTLVMLNNYGGQAGALTTLNNILPNARNMEQSPASSFFGQQGDGTINKAIFGPSISGAKNWARASLPYTKWTRAGATVDWQLFTLPPKTKLTAIYLDVTVGFTGAPCACTMRAGTSAGATDLIVSSSVAAPVTLGTTSGQLGTLMASPVQGGWMTWAGSDLFLRLDGAGGNIGNGTTTLLSTGNVDIYIQTERVTGP